MPCDRSDSEIQHRVADPARVTLAIRGRFGLAVIDRPSIFGDHRVALILVIRMGIVPAKHSAHVDTTQPFYNDGYYGRSIASF